MANRSTFPTTIDTFIEHFDINASDVPKVQRFQQLKLQASRTPVEDDELAQLTIDLRNKIISPEDFNKFQDCLVNMETFIKDNVEGYITTKQGEMNTYVNTKKTEVLTYTDAKKQEMYDYTEQKKGELDSLVSRTEANVVISESQPSSGLYDGLMWYKPSTEETKVYLSGAFRDVGGGGGVLEKYSSSLRLPAANNRATIGISSYNKSKDMLLVYQGGIFLREGAEYRVSVDSTQIVKLPEDGSVWEKDTYFDFVVLTSMPAKDTLNSITITNLVTVESDDTTNIQVGIPEFNSNMDILRVYHKNVMLYYNADWKVGADNISIDLLGFSLNTGDNVYFEVMKKIRNKSDGTTMDGALLLNASVGINKLSTGVFNEVDNRINIKINEVNDRIDKMSDDIKCQIWMGV